MDHHLNKPSYSSVHSPLYESYCYNIGERSFELLATAVNINLKHTLHSPTQFRVSPHIPAYSIDRNIHLLKIYTHPYYTCAFQYMA
ncbi:unnamed protein product [Onchocerca flexuosa]|uniref:Ovule protein n=1 Tax=Onchocerca flexuosa TaxID=387005 RepID=A0A183H2W4_9BILA|nr:unnamed protein product [Onchocerca flexuosa]